MARKPATKSAAKPAAAKKPPAKKPAAKAASKSTTRKPAPKKPAAKKPAAKTAAAKKPAARKPAASRAPAKKPAARKPAATTRAKGKAQPGATAAAPEANLEFTASRQFVSWLFEMNASLVFTTYQSGKVFMIGLQPNGRLSVFERTFNRCMGLGLTDDGFYMSSLYQLWKFQNVLEDGQDLNGYDRAYLPINGHTTGDLDIHDVAVGADGRVVFVNTLFSCLATIDNQSSFVPLWQPPFVSRLAAEDRCHLNGLAMENGRPAYVTAVAESDVADGWRDKRTDGGCVIDVASKQVVARGLSMPHSPRVHKGQLWILNSGTGEIGTIDRAAGTFQPLAFCPGYLRGLHFVGDFVVVGLSKPRENRTFSGLPLDAALAERNAEAQCGLYVIDTRTGDVVHWLKIDGIVEELYDVAAIPGTRRPMAFGFKTDEIRRAIRVGEEAAL